MIKVAGVYMYLEDWARDIFQKRWDEKKRQLGSEGRLPRINYSVWDPKVTMGSAKHYEEYVFNVIVNDVEFMDSITKPYGVRWSVNPDKTLTFSID